MFTQKPVCEFTYSIVALFITIKNWKLKCPSTAERINTLPHHHTTEHYSAIKRNEPCWVHATTQMNLKCVLTHNSFYDILSQTKLQERKLKSGCWGWEDMLTTKGIRTGGMGDGTVLDLKGAGSFMTMCAGLSRFSRGWLCANPWTVAHQAPLSMGFSRQEYWSGLTCPFQGIFLTRGSNQRLLHLLHCRRILYCWATREALHDYKHCQNSKL